MSCRLDEAVEHFERAIALDPAQAALYASVAKIHMHLDRDDAALDALRRGIRAADDPDRTILLIDCGVKYNIIRYLLERDTTVIRVPWDYDFSQEEYDAWLDRAITPVDQRGMGIRRALVMEGRRIQHHLQIDVVPGALADAHHRRAHPRGVRHLVGVQRPAVALAYQPDVDMA